MKNGQLVIAHLSDLHLGYHSGRHTSDDGVNMRENDGYNAFKQMVVQIAKDDEVDVVLIAGDLFHTPEPSVRTAYVAQKCLRYLHKAGKRVFCLTGNHDVSDVKTEMAATALVNDPDLDIHAYWQPYKKADLGNGVILHMVSHHLYKEQANTWDVVKPIPGAVNIFTTHGSMIDPVTKLALHTEASPREVIIPDEIIGNPDWTYRLLGHIHERGFVGSKDNGRTDTAGLKTYYNGSAIRRGFSDGVTPLGRGWTKWTVGTDGTLTPEFKRIPQRPQIDFKVIDATKLSASDITDLITDNLDATLKDVPDGDWSNAPIIRQKVINMTPEKRRAMDNRLIAEDSSKALQWTLSIRSVEETEKDKEKAEKTEKIGVSGNVESQFDDWLTDSDEYKRLHEGIRDKVADETKRFIKQGQESVLDVGDEE